VKAKKLAFLGLLFVSPIVICCLSCSLLTVGDAVNLHLRRQAARRIYQEELGIDNSDDELEAFMTKELKGLTREEIVEKLGQWGDVEVRDCSNIDTHGWCVIQVSNFLGTGFGHEFTVIFVNSRAESVMIYYS
jgi:hypothetical protein